ncbi:cysteine-rich RLK (RECEPTOR-like protein kinase) 8 [Abeliophyllum distichum]|uniref:Cysteine-rich RLK (RECEPTOR-like protein kinase) 8 n=1 Tax=Abeliophyllum distichum TaxID=126358 RepID=A0ABD1W021_9LAMI
MEHPASSSDVSAPAPGSSDAPNTNNEQNMRKQPPSWIQKAHPLDNILSDSGDDMMIRRKLANELRNVCYTLQIEPKNINKGYAQLEGVDFDETFAHVARIESIRLLLYVACQMRFKLHQMDVKSAFLNGILNEEVYVEQPKRFVDPYSPGHVFRLKKALTD